MIEKGIGRRLYKTSRGVMFWLIAVDIALALSGHIYHATKNPNNTHTTQAHNDIVHLDSSIVSNLPDYNAIVMNILRNDTGAVGVNTLRSHFPDDLSFQCFVDMMTASKLDMETKSAYYGYILGLYVELGAPKLDTARCLLNSLRLNCPHAGISTVCFHGKPATESVFIAELSHHAQFMNNVRSDVGLGILDVARVYNTPRHWYDKIAHGNDIYCNLYDEPGNFESEAHSIIEPMLREKLFRAVAHKLANDSVYLDIVKSDIHMHAQAISAITTDLAESKEVGKGIFMGTRSLEQVHSKYRFIAYLPADHPLKIYTSDELKRYYLRYLYIVCNSDNPKRKCLFTGGVISLIEFGKFFNFTAMEKQEVTNALRRLTESF